MCTYVRNVIKHRDAYGGVLKRNGMSMALLFDLFLYVHGDNAYGGVLMQNGMSLVASLDVASVRSIVAYPSARDDLPGKGATYRSTAYKCRRDDLHAEETTYHPRLYRKLPALPVDFGPAAFSVRTADLYAQVPGKSAFCML